MTEAVAPLLDPVEGRIVHVASASGPNFVARLPEAQKAFWADPAELPATWEELQAALAP